jgi:hypothetical protein
MGRLVIRYDPQLALEPLEGAWIASGGNGKSNLNAYRCGKLDGVPVFEKIYLLDSEAWRRLAWFHENIAPRLEGRVRTPRLIHQVQGNRLAAVYFEYAPEISSSSIDECLDTITALHMQLMDLDMTGEPSWVADFRLEPQYASGVVCLRRILAAAGRDPSEIDTVEETLLAGEARKILTHGDLMPGNISRDGTILDWDRCGVFPIGYDYSRVIGSFIICNFMHDFETLIRGDIARTCAAVPGSLHFFAVIEYAKKQFLPGRASVSDGLILALFDRACELQGVAAWARRSA